MAAIAAIFLGLGLGAFAIAGASASVATPLQVSLKANGAGASATFNSDGNIVLTPGTDAATTYAQAVVTNAGSAEPGPPPSFITSAYAAGSPRWVIELSSGYYMFGYPVQLGGGALPDFTGPQWELKGPGGASNAKCGLKVYDTYANVLKCADPAGTATVTSAFIVADGDQAAGTQDVLTGVQYDGMFLGSGCAVTISKIAAQTSVLGKPVTAVTASATVNTSDKTVTYTASNLPSGLSIDPATGKITGTPTETGTSVVQVTATSPYTINDAVCSATTSFNWSITLPSPSPSPSPTPSPTPSSSPGGSGSGSGSGTPSGGVETGGGLSAGTSPLVPAGAATGILAIFLLGAFVVRRRVRREG